MTRPRVVGADLSLAGSALATTDTVRQLATRGTRADRYPQRLRRLRTVSSWVLTTLEELDPQLLVVEAPAPNAVQRLSVWDRAHLWWTAVDWADARGVALAYAPPTCVKKYATDNGRADKPAMRDAARAAFPRLPVRNDNDADAAWLMAMGHAWHGTPLLQLPPTHTRSLSGVAWPTPAALPA